ncbi:MAG: DUF2269 family protein [Candidatus Adiutrix sp.]|jgi:hypothetical protein|nr:DUF2269 family protein [Candidatus Adiutrix sp.]
MKKFSARGQRTLKIIHLVTACLWLGGAAAINLMILWLGPGESGPELVGYDLARKFIDDLVLIPGAMGCLLSGLLICWLTPWGFFRHRWVAVKWVLTVACILFGTFYMGPRLNGQHLISQELGLAAVSDPLYVANRFHNILGGVVQVLSLLFLVVISVLKPWKKKAAPKIPAGQEG